MEQVFTSIFLDQIVNIVILIAYLQGYVVTPIIALDIYSLSRILLHTETHIR